jgi:dCMP deaminase
MIIGLTGKNGAGKGEAARELVRLGFEYHSLSDVLREELKRRKRPVTRDNLTRLGNELRRAHGPGVLAAKTLARLDPHKNAVVDSFRNPGEVEAFRKNGSFALISVVASPRVRFARIRTRARENDPKALREFLFVEKREDKPARAGDIHPQNISACIAAADAQLPNNGTLFQLRERVAPLLQKLLIKQKRPTWDEYFINIAKVVASRSNCMKRKVAALIVKEGRIISTGYNGTPRGTKNCSEGGCPRCNGFAPSGSNLEECFCSHGEENAIVQAAYHGISIKGSTMYTTCSPCLLCTKMIINAGIIEVVYNESYPLSKSSFQLLRQAGIKLR